MVSFEKWDCVVANTTNLLQSIGHYITFIQKRIESGLVAFKAVEQGLRAVYCISHLPKEMIFAVLSHIAKELCLSLVVSICP